MLTKRLNKIGSFIPPNSIVADIGGDHAWLLIHFSKKIKSGIVGELNKGPYLNACSNISGQGLSDLIQIRRGNGLEVLSPGEADVIVIAGMGGILISDILENGKNNTSDVLILQPNNGSDSVRRWLYENNYIITEEDIVEEKNILYEIISAQRSNCQDEQYNDLELDKEILFEIGPLLWEKKDPLLLKKLELEIDYENRVLNQLNMSNQNLSETKDNFLNRIKIKNKLISMFRDINESII